MLREARVGRLATADATGRPLVVPVCFTFDGAALNSAKRRPEPAGQPAR
jgi:nitroimidazol reductase NimA-like FMN-containing flavoprotein (pyridoxamine 5'-phosphate oxidase superfamily)